MENYLNFDINDIAGEQWAECGKGNQCYYMVSNLGRVKSIRKSNGKEKILKQVEKSDGYFWVSIGVKNQYIHRLVAQCFLPNPENKETVNHENGIKSDNKTTNLSWATQQEQVNHAYDFNLRNDNIPVVVIDTNAEVIGEYRSRFELAGSDGLINKTHSVKKYNNKVWFKNNKAYIEKNYFNSLTEDEKFTIATECFKNMLRYAFIVDDELHLGINTVANIVGCGTSNVIKKTKKKTNVVINNHKLMRLNTFLGVVK